MYRMESMQGRSQNIILIEANPLLLPNSPFLSISLS